MHTMEKTSLSLGRLIQHLSFRKCLIKVKSINLIQIYDMSYNKYVFVHLKYEIKQEMFVKHLLCSPHLKNSVKKMS